MRCAGSRHRTHSASTAATIRHRTTISSSERESRPKTRAPSFAPRCPRKPASANWPSSQSAVSRTSTSWPSSWMSFATNCRVALMVIAPRGAGTLVEPRARWNENAPRTHSVSPSTRTSLHSNRGISNQQCPSHSHGTSISDSMSSPNQGRRVTHRFDGFGVLVAIERFDDDFVPGNRLA